MKKTISLLIILAMILIFPAGMNTAFAEGDTKIILEVQDNATEVMTNETFKVYVKALKAAELYGLQLTLKYDPSMIKVVDNGIKIDENMTVFGGKTEDFSKGILTYPFINTSDKKKDEIQVMEITFKAVKSGPVLITLSNMKAVDKDSKTIHYNTQYQAVLNIIDSSQPTPIPSLEPTPVPTTKPTAKPTEEPGTTEQPQVTTSPTPAPTETVKPSDPTPSGNPTDPSNETPNDPGDPSTGENPNDPGEEPAGENPAGGEAKGSGSPWLYVVIGLAVVILGGVGYYIVKNKNNDASQSM